MKLAGLRKLAVGKQQRIRFRLSNGLECEVDERGVALVPALRSVPDFDLERELESAASFVLVAARSGERQAERTVNRAELEAMVSGGAAAAVHEEAED